MAVSTTSHEEGVLEAFLARRSFPRVPRDHLTDEVQGRRASCWHHFLQARYHLVSRWLNQSAWQVGQSDARRHVETLLPGGRYAANKTGKSVKHICFRRTWQERVACEELSENAASGEYVH